MKMERKIIALSVFAFVIGIAIILPPYLTLGIGATAQAYDKPWFNIEIPYARFETKDIANKYFLTTVTFQPSINYKVLSQQPEARIEYLEYTVYTENGMQLAKNTYCLSITNTGEDDPTELLSFCRDNWFDTSYFNTNSSSYSNYHIMNPTQLPPAITPRGIYFVNDDEYNLILATLEDTQTIYLDVKRVGYITFDGDNTVITLANNQIMQHIELTKDDNAFTFGDPSYAQISTLIQIPDGLKNSTATDNFGTLVLPSKKPDE